MVAVVAVVLDPTHCGSSGGSGGVLDTTNLDLAYLEPTLVVGVVVVVAGSGGCCAVAVLVICEELDTAEYPSGLTSMDCNRRKSTTEGCYLGFSNVTNRFIVHYSQNIGTHLYL